MMLIDRLTPLVRYEYDPYELVITLDERTSEAWDYSLEVKAGVRLDARILADHRRLPVRIVDCAGYVLASVQQ